MVGQKGRGAADKRDVSDVSDATEPTAPATPTTTATTTTTTTTTQSFVSSALERVRGASRTFTEMGRAVGRWGKAMADNVVVSSVNSAVGTVLQVSIRTCIRPLQQRRIASGM